MAGSDVKSATTAAAPSEAHVAIAMHGGVASLLAAVQAGAIGCAALSQLEAPGRLERPAHASAEGTQKNWATSKPSATARRAGRVIEPNNTLKIPEVPAPP